MEKEIKMLPMKSGYYIGYYGVENNNPKIFNVIYVDNNYKAQIIDWDWGKDWTHTWIGAPINIGIVDSEKTRKSMLLERFIYFKSHKDLLKFSNIKLKLGALNKSNIDI